MESRTCVSCRTAGGREREKRERDVGEGGVCKSRAWINGATACQSRASAGCQSQHQLEKVEYISSLASCRSPLTGLFFNYQGSLLSPTHTHIQLTHILQYRVTIYGYAVKENVLYANTIYYTIHYTILYHILHTTLYAILVYILCTMLYKILHYTVT